jgi:beta-phosphoglucomutase-like phosphatase (HAD superfamily)
MDGVLCCHRSRGRLEPVIGAREFIDWCRQIGLKLAVAGGADNVTMENNLRQVNLPAGLFDTVVTGEEIARKKPDPEVFLLAARRMGLRPDDCLVIAGAVSGVQSAKSAGCKCLGLTGSFSEGDLLNAGADWVAPDLASVPEGVLEIE